MRRLSQAAAPQRMGREALSQSYRQTIRPHIAPAAVRPRPRELRADAHTMLRLPNDTAAEGRRSQRQHPALFQSPPTSLRQLRQQHPAASYDALTTDVGYEKRADFLEKLFRRSRIPVHTVLDLACGTGTMTWLLTGRGYELIGVDGSEEMLAAAMEKSGQVEGIPPIFLHQSMPQLDLYGTVDAAICCLDSLNYLTRPADVQRTFRRLHLFIAPGGLLVFDINTVAKLAALDGQVFLDETEDTYCVWRTEYHRGLCTYYMDLFDRRRDGAWQRELEIHRQRAYTTEELTGWLRAAGFNDIRTWGDGKLRRPTENEQRIYFSCIRE